MKTIDSLSSSSADIEILQRCKKAITTAVADAEVILYGSRARGDAREYSDYDIIVLVNGPVNMSLKKKILDHVYPLELETAAVLTLIVYNKQQWDSPLYRAMPLHKNIDKDGVLL